MNGREEARLMAEKFERENPVYGKNKRITDKERLKKNGRFKHHINSATKRHSGR